MGEITQRAIDLRVAGECLKTMKLDPRLAAACFRAATDIDELERSHAALREALAELVRLKLLKDSMVLKTGPEADAALADYNTNKPKAWKRAAALASQGNTEPGKDVSYEQLAAVERAARKNMALRTHPDENISLIAASDLELQKALTVIDRAYEGHTERGGLDELLATVAGIPCRFCMGPGNADGPCPNCGKP